MHEHLPIFCKSNKNSIQDWGEIGCINKITQILQPESSYRLDGLGDDAAVIQPPTPVGVVTVDSLVYGIHFDDSASPGQAGAKLVNRNLSDIAAMGGKPLYGVLALILSADVSKEWFKGFVLGIRDAAATSGLHIVGGDISSASHQSFAGSLTLIGETARPLSRRSSKPGDLLWVTGKLGATLPSGHHLNFKPRLEEGQFLAGVQEVGAVIDLTDGLAKDLPTILPPGYPAMLNLDAIPLRDSEGERSRSKIIEAFTDGEDYELLFSLPPGKNVADFVGEWQSRFQTSLTCIGSISNEPLREGEALLRDDYGIPLGDLRGFEQLK